MSEVLLAVSNLHHAYRRRIAVDDVSFQVASGEVLGFLGRNGAGKSTTMKLLCGVLPVRNGQVSIGGHDLATAPAPAKAALGYLPEHPPLVPEFSVREYLRFCGRLRGLSGRNLRSRLDAVIDICHLDDVHKRLIAKLSKGFQQRVGIAQALIHDPRVVILDEPTTGLDPVEFKHLRGVIRALASDRAVVLSTHILQEVRETCDRVQIMHHGKLVFRSRDDTTPPLTMAFRRPPPTEALAAVPDIDEVVALGDGWFRATAGPQAEDAIAERAHANAWQLMHLSRDHNALDEVFYRFAEDQSDVA